MLDRIRHQLATWRYGAGLLVTLAVFAFLALIPGAFLWAIIVWLLDLPFYGRGWATCTALCAPFFLPGLARSIAIEVSSNPPPKPGRVS